MRQVLDQGVRRLPGGRLAGGTPRRLIRLSPAGVEALAALERADSGPAGAALAARLRDAGLAHPRPEPWASVADITVVIPVRDRAAELERCLRAVGSEAAMLVIDDGSADPGAVAAVCARLVAPLIRRPVSGGPAAARNAGLVAARTPLVAFIDSDCIPPRDWLRRLAGHFADPTVVAVAPRIRALTGVRTPLDMGAGEGPVDPEVRVRYVPAAALLVRRGPLRFDEALRYGEDVDFVWRLRDAGGRVRYDPSVVVRHAEPATVRAGLVRRFRYGTSAAPLAARHPSRLAPAVITADAALVALALARGRPRAAAVVWLGAAAARGVRARRRGVPAAVAAGWALESTGQATLQFARFTGTFALPLIARNPRLLAVACAPALTEYVRARPAIDPLRWTAVALAENAAYGAGVAWGALRARSPRALVPRFGWVR